MSKRRNRRRKAQKPRREARDQEAFQVETRDPRNRWKNLRARGGQVLTFVPTGLVVQVGDEMDEAPALLAAAVMGVTGDRKGGHARLRFAR